MRAEVFTTVLAFLLAGCVTAPGASVFETEGDDVPAFLALDHDHKDAALHRGAANMTLAAYLPVCEPSAPCSFGELDVMGDLAILAITEPDGGFALLDLREPASPRVLSTTTFGRAFATDVKLAPDGRTAFVGVSNWFPLVGRPGFTADPATATGIARSQGVQVYDVSDPTRPALRWFEPIGAQGVHMLDVHVIGGEMIVFATTPAYFLFAPPDVRSAAEPVWIGRYDDATGRIEALSQYVPPEADVREGDGDAAHDITVVDDPEGPLLFAAFSYGVSVARVADPAAPEHLGTWKLADEGLDTAIHNAHTVMVQEVEGRRALIVTPEQAEANLLYAVDAEDLSAMRMLGTWHLPGDLAAYQGIQWSMHNVNLLDGKAYVAHYHGGVWALDVSTAAALAAPVTLGHYAPVETGQVGPGLPEVWAGPTAPNAWDVVPAKGYVLVSDITSGFYVLRTAWDMPTTQPYGTRGA